MKRDKPLRRKKPLQNKTPLQPGKPLERKTPLKAGGNLDRSAPLRKQSKKRQAENRERKAMVLTLWPDGTPMCAVKGCEHLADDVHEPLTRARGGSITDPNNAVPLCRTCHTEITDRQPVWAYEQGLLKHSWEVDPGETAEQGSAA